MERKRRIWIVCIVLVLIMVGLLWFVRSPSTIDVLDATGVSVETIDKEQRIEQFPVENQEDIAAIKNALSNGMTSEPGFVFAEGGYRIVLTQANKKLVLYPYCGDLETIRVGNAGSDYYFLKEGSEAYKKLNEVLTKYIDLERYCGIYNWD